MRLALLLTWFALGVVSSASDHDIAAGTAIEDVVARVAAQQVVTLIAE